MSIKEVLDLAYISGHKIYTAPATGRAVTDYQREMEIARRGGHILWNGESHRRLARIRDLEAILRNTPQTGDLFFFIHQDKKDPCGGTADLHIIKEITPPGTGRSEWNDDDQLRDVFHLSECIGTISVEELCNSVIKFNFEPGRTWFQGNRRYSWRDDYTVTTSVNPVPETTLDSTVAQFWDVPPELELREIVEDVRNKMNNSANKEIIHYDTVDAVVRNFMMLVCNNSGGRGVSVADMQSGKTEMMILLSAAFRKLLAAYYNLDIENVHVGILYVSNKSQTTLYNQNVKRFKEAGFDDREPDTGEVVDNWLVSELDEDTVVQTVMLSNRAIDRLDQIDQNFNNKQVNFVLILLDEAHTAIKDEQQLATFINNRQRQNNQGYTWFNPDTYFLGVTATPLQAFILPDVKGDTPLYYTYAKPGAGYYGIKDMFADDRIRNLESKDVNEDRIFEEFKKIGDESINSGSGYIIVRVSNKDRETFIKVSSTLGFEVLEYSSNNKNISNLNRRLKTPTKEMKVILLKEAAGAGDTFDKIEHIRAVFDLRYKSDEPRAQSIGRYCGWARDRRSAEFPIYTSKKELQRWLRVMDQCARGDDVYELRTESNRNSRTPNELNKLQLMYNVGRITDPKLLELIKQAPENWRLKEASVVKSAIIEYVKQCVSSQLPIEVGKRKPTIIQPRTPSGNSANDIKRVERYWNESNNVDPEDVNGIYGIKIARGLPTFHNKDTTTTEVKIFLTEDNNLIVAWSILNDELYDQYFSNELPSGAPWNRTRSVLNLMPEASRESAPPQDSSNDT